jgi:pimeloyl-ACP methyl ester carboxylesterase
VSVAIPEGECPTRDDEPARPASIFGELRALPELLSAPASAAVVAYLAPVGPPRPVLVIPGFISGDSATFGLRTFLRSIGHRPHGWGLGINVGAAHHVADGIDRVLTDLFDEYGEPIDIVGWSAGGIIGRILASHRTEMVRQVISLGTPIRMSSDQTNIGAVSDAFGRFFVKTPLKIDVDRVPVPSTAVWTRSDGVVPGNVCRQTPSSTAETIEVRGSHVGLVSNPAVFYLIADRLAQPLGQWNHFIPPRRLKRLYPSIDR